MQGSAAASISAVLSDRGDPAAGHRCCEIRLLIALTDFLFWHWWLLAAVLVLSEMSWPRFILLQISFVASAMGFVALVVPTMPVALQFALFACISGALLWLSRRHALRQPLQERSSAGNRIDSSAHRKQRLY